ncbi:MAG: thioredoxin-like domain-containing protein [Flavobacterium sp.]|nr:thioredoxin-like domain-containing protein [Flavobacterium sp.]
MIAYSKKLLSLFSVATLGLLCSCNKEFSSDNYIAYFGGEVVNPKSNYVLFLKDDEVIDTLFLNEKNQFFKKFDSLAPGMYTFKHDPEYQYVYFDKNDSLMVRINSVDFDESIVYCGRGDEKNNFLMELFLKNQEDRSTMFDIFDYDTKKFLATIETSLKKNENFYTKKKEKIKWNDEFDLYANALLQLHHNSKKEIYPIAHKLRTGIDVNDSLPKNYYNHRKTIDFNNSNLTSYSPFVRYLTYMMSNVSYTNVKSKDNLNEALEIHLHKLNIADTLFKKEKVKNKILNSVAFSYLLEDQNIANNSVFIKRFNDLSTDKESLDEINKLANSIQLLNVGAELPEVMLHDLSGNTISSKSILKRKSVIFFWTSNATSHLSASHKKAIDFQKAYPDYQFIAINIDDNQEEWLQLLKQYKFGVVNEFRVADFEDLKSKWAINKLQRTIIIDQNGTIKNAFVNLFDVKFPTHLQ